MFITNSDPTAELDVTLMIGGDKISVVAGPVLRETKWRGGQYVMYVTDPLGGEYMVEKSDGNAVVGFLLFQSEDYLPPPPPFGVGPGSPQNYTSFQYTEGIGGQNVITAVFGNARAFFKIYETRQLVGGVRTGPPAVYNLNDYLKISENGLLCNDSDAALALAGVTDPVVVGICSAVPVARNQFRLGLDQRL